MSGRPFQVGDTVELISDVRFLKAGSHGVVTAVRDVSGERVCVLDIAPKFAFRETNLRLISGGCGSEHQ